MLFLQLILFFFIFALVVGLVMVLSFIGRVHSVAKQFRSQMNGGNGFSGGGSSFSSGGMNSGTGRESGEQVYDGGSPLRSDKKIIPKEEGEYVDFEEVSEP